MRLFGEKEEGFGRRYDSGQHMPGSPHIQASNLEMPKLAVCGSERSTP